MLYCGSSSTYLILFSSNICFASSTVFPTKFGICTSFGLVAFDIPIVAPKLIANNRNKPTIEDITLCFFTNSINLFGFLFFFCVALGSWLSPPKVSILCVGNSPEYSLLSTKFPFGSFNALFRSNSISVAL